MQTISTPMMSIEVEQADNEINPLENMTMPEILELSNIEPPAIPAVSKPPQLNNNSREPLAEGDFQYSINHDKSTVTITRYIRINEEVIIPNIIDNKTVTFIDDSAFYDCHYLVIRCYINSYAYDYANEHGIPTESISGASISINVKDIDGKLICNYSVNWYEKGVDTIIATGNLLNDFDNNRQYQYEIVLDEVNGVVYKQLPNRVTL